MEYAIGDSTNFQVDNENGHYYLTDGLISLKQYCVSKRLSYNVVLTVLKRKGYHVDEANRETLTAI